MFGLGLQELLILLAIVMVLFGGKKLPELASGMGKALRNFKKASTGTDEIDVTPKDSSMNEKTSIGEGKGVKA